MLDDTNDDRRKVRLPIIRFDDPQGWHGKGEGLMAFIYHAPLWQRRHRSLEKDSLSWGRTGEGRNNIEKMPGRGHDVASPLTFLLLRVLCFALAEIDLNPMTTIWADRAKTCRHMAALPISSGDIKHGGSPTYLCR